MVDALLEPILKLNNVNNNLTMEKSSLDLRLFYVWTEFIRGGGWDENF